MSSQPKITLIIDVFRAFTTAAYILEQEPSGYFLTNKCSIVKRLSSHYSSSLMIGKPEKLSNLTYNIPNSPTRAANITIKEKIIIHRTEAGAKGVLEANPESLIFCVSFVNADATVNYLKRLHKPIINIIPMGHEGVTPSFEDDLCKMYIEALLMGQEMDVTPYLPRLKEGSGKYFFSSDQYQYPQADFNKCLEIRRFDYLIEAVLMGDYACLKKKHWTSYLEVQQ